MKQISPITIIGIGLGRDDLSISALRKVAAAQVLIGGSRQLAMFPEHAGQKIIIRKDAAALVKRLGSQIYEKKTVVLASGDPNFHGIAALFYECFPKEQISVIPNITAFQSAFARIKEPWDTAALVSLHGKNIKALDELVRIPGLYCVYCDNTNSPSAVAAYLIEKDSGMAKCQAWFFDSLGTDEERIFSGPLKKMLKVQASPLSMLIIKNDRGWRRHSLGIPDEMFAHDRGMITRRDVRLIALARLELHDGLVLWDIGAGTGSVAIEAANAYPGIHAYAIEKNNRRFNQLKSNIRRFCTPNVSPLLGDAALLCCELTAPDRIFIGGSGGELAKILKIIKKTAKEGTVIVVNCVTMDSLDTVLSWFKKWKWHYEVTSVNNSQLMSERKPEIFRSENPVFIVQGRAAITRGL
jgi:precorrin-6B C5,15-methyltransferase / cobalt-precorrin-6B C5,C15-methyltransferase